MRDFIGSLGDVDSSGDMDLLGDVDSLDVVDSMMNCIDERWSCAERRGNCERSLKVRPPIAQQIYFIGLLEFLSQFVTTRDDPSNMVCSCPV